MTAVVPPPKRGGTYLFICPWIISERIPGGVRVTWCAEGRHGTRFRRLRAYRRHWLRCHGS